jgi:hypothetical protein
MLHMHRILEIDLHTKNNVQAKAKQQMQQTKTRDRPYSLDTGRPSTAYAD